MNWLKLIEQLAPIVLAATPAAPLAPFVAIGIAHAEALKGASGPDKQAHALAIVNAGIQATNAVTGKDLIDPAIANQTALSAIDTVVNVANIVSKAQAAK
jgi:hypothetical protein